MRRVITYEMRSGATAITDAINLKENVPNTTDSCSNPVLTGNAGFVSSDDLPNNGFQFDDGLNACPKSFFINCSFTYANQQWQQKNADGSFTTIGTVGAVSVTTAAEATVAGNNTSLTGHTFLP